jgi:GAF domain-containing protein
MGPPGRFHPALSGTSRLTARDNRPVDGIPAILARLLADTGASRVTLRRDVPGPDVFPVVEEALAPGVGSLREERTVHLPTQPVVREILQGRQVVQDDCASAYDDPAFHAMLAIYGGLRAQIVTPILVEGTVCAILSLHQLGVPRAWTEDEIARCSRAAEQVKELL